MTVDSAAVPTVANSSPKKPFLQAADPAELSPGTLIDGRYRVIRVIGVGGTGIVYEVEHDRTGQRLALKTLLDPGQAPRLEQEARALARLRSPHVVKVVELGQCEAGPFMVMTLLVGRNLRDVLESKVRLPLSFVANLAVQVCEGLDEAHRVGLVHRDLKPDNMHLADPADADTETTGDFSGAEGPSGRPPHDLTFVTVFDFGVVKMSAAELNNPLTRTGSTVGTPYYMSLEQLRGAGTVDAQSDVYALCVMLYECLAGQRPFEAGTLGDLIFAICSMNPAPLSTLRSDLPQDLCDVVMRGLSREKKDRPQTMRDLARAFAPHADPTFTMWLRVGDGHGRSMDPTPSTPPLRPEGSTAPMPQLPPLSAPAVSAPAAGAAASPAVSAPAATAPAASTPAASAPAASAPAATAPAASAPAASTAASASAAGTTAPPKVRGEPLAGLAPPPRPLTAAAPRPLPPSRTGLAPHSPKATVPMGFSIGDGPRSGVAPPAAPPAPRLGPPPPPPSSARGALGRTTARALDAPVSSESPASIDEESSTGTGDRETPTEMFMPKIHGELEEPSQLDLANPEPSSLSDLGRTLPSNEDKTAILDIAALQKNPPNPSPHYVPGGAAAGSSAAPPPMSGGMIPTTALPLIDGTHPDFAKMTARIPFPPSSQSGMHLGASHNGDTGAPASPFSQSGQFIAPSPSARPKWETVLNDFGNKVNVHVLNLIARFRRASQEQQIVVVMIGTASLAVLIVFVIWALWLS